MRAIFVICNKEAPSLKEPKKWSQDLVDFLSKCTVKNAEGKVVLID